MSPSRTLARLRAHIKLGETHQTPTTITVVRNHGVLPFDI
jgi:hypothetical protein